MTKTIVLFGVAGCGKTTVGLALAKKLNFRFLDADDFHSPENVDKMSKGIPLCDEDRVPWLLNLHNEIRSRQVDTVLACSALKRSYRSLLVRGRSSSVLNELPPKPGLLSAVNGCLKTVDEADDSFSASGSSPILFVHLKGSKELIRDRMMRRSGHFMPTDLIQSQFDALEEVDDDESDNLRPSVSAVVDISQSLEEIVLGINLILEESIDSLY